MDPRDYPARLRALLYGAAVGTWEQGTARVTYHERVDYWTWALNGVDGISDLHEDVSAALTTWTDTDPVAPAPVAGPSPPRYCLRFGCTKPAAPRLKHCPRRTPLERTPHV